MSGISSLGSLSQGMMRSFAPPSFSSIDTNSDGGISLDELTTNAPGGVSDAKSESRAAKLFEKMDDNGDGTVTSEEKDAFDAAMADRMSEMQFAAQMLASTGRPEDSGGQGGFKEPDLDAAASDILSALDTDSDGSVSLSELSSSEVAEGYGSDQLESLFDAIDTDSSGSVSEDEISSFIENNKPESPPMGAGGPPPPPSSGPESSGASSDESASSESYDVLDTNEDGVVSLEERLTATLGSVSVEELTTSALGMLSAALSAYSSSSGSTTSTDSLLSTLFSTLDAEV